MFLEIRGGLEMVGMGLVCKLILGRLPGKLSEGYSFFWRDMYPVRVPGLVLGLNVHVGK